jgi:hypothetical protein
MSYRIAAEMPGMDWKKAFGDFYHGRNDVEVATLQIVLDLPDKFVPGAINSLTDADLPILMGLAKGVEKMAQQNSYNALFGSLINKAIVLVLENFPEAFDTLTPEEKEKIFGIKLELPDETAVFNQVYAYTQRREELPFGTIHNGATMKSVLEKLAPEVKGGAVNGGAANGQKAPDQRVINALCSMDSQYNRHFWDTMPMH